MVVTRQNGAMSDDILDAWSRRARMTIDLTRDDVLFGRGDIELAYRLRADGEGFAVTREDHGSERPFAVLPTRADADRCLLLMFAVPWRSDQRLPPVREPLTDAGCEVTREGEGWRVAGSGASAWFRAQVNAEHFCGAQRLSLDELDALMLSGAE